jgi:2-methylcitrate dehydratase PrpD
VAASLAQRGFTADASIFESRMGFCALFGIGPGKLEAAAPRLGRTYALLEPILYLKLYPCGFPLQRPIDCAIELAESHDLKPDDIADVRCGVHYLIPETVFHDDPQAGLQGRTSIPYCVARAIIDRRMGLAQFSDEKVQDPVVRSLMARVHAEVPPELSREALRGKVNAIAAPATMRITLRDGRVLTTRVEYFRGAPERPLSRDEVVAKYRDCARMALDDDRVDRAREAIEHLEDVEDAAELVRLLVTAAV